jgi:hypothetical protein
MYRRTVDAQVLEKRRSSGVDTITVIGLSSLAYIVSVFLHELGGHGLSCAFLGGHIAELGGFYVDCQYTGMADAAIRLVALAGPLVSVVTGIGGFLLFRRLQKGNTHGRYFTWLVGTISLLQAAGYLVFSGITGLGDFGTSRDGVVYQLTPAWLWRGGLTVVGVLAYALAISLSLKRVDEMIGGSGIERIRRAQRLSLLSYITGGVVSIVIGSLNPHGLVIVLSSAAASSLGGTSALAWMMHLLNRTKQAAGPPLRLERHWIWVISAVVVTLVYALVFGPTIRL